MIGFVIACDYAERRAARHLPTEAGLQSRVRRPLTSFDIGLPGSFRFDDVRAGSSAAPQRPTRQD